ncbi:MAG TPA: C45 family peptidase [Candidatus Acidoferrales bacterium]|nr:C45 family peptidase [Candidatus Acidoferrales bacterium]
MASARWNLLTALLSLGVLIVISSSLVLQGERIASAESRNVSTALPALATPSDLRLSGSYRFERGGWIYVHLQGSPDQIGFQHGYLLAPEIADALATIKLDDTHSTKRPWEFFREAAHNMLWPHIEAEYQAELKGITAGVNARGVKMDIDDVVALNAFEELPDYYVPWYNEQHKVAEAPDIKTQGNCSAFVATGSWTKDHQIVIAHNNWTNYMTGERWRIMFDIAPQHGYRMIMDGFPGVITSDDDFGVNSDGLMITETTITQFRGWNPNGIPEFVRSRKAMQYASSIDDYVKIMLDGNNGGYANDWLLGDRKTGEIAQLELGLKAHKLYRTKDGYFVGANFTSDPEVTKLDTTFDPTNMETSPNARHTRWDELMEQNKGKIDVQLAEKFEGDHYDAFAKRDVADQRTLCGHADVAARGIPVWNWGPHFPGGAVQGKVTDSKMAEQMSLIAHAGHPCGANFYAKPFLAAHPEYDWQAPQLHDMIAGPWTEFRSGERAGQ